MIRLSISFLLIIINSISVLAQINIPDEVKQPIPELSNGILVVDDFEDDMVGKLPDRWYNRDVKNAANEPEESRYYSYFIDEVCNNKYLHYEGTDARHLNFPLKERENLNIYETPILSWKWRGKQIPEGGDELENHKNDAAASIYVVFDMGRVALFKKVPKSIRYTWSSTLEKGSENSIFYGNQKIVVLESGSENIGEHWITVEQNIVEDYRRLFGDDPPARPLAILILSDGNSVNDTAEADYDDIMFKSLDQRLIKNTKQ